LAAGAEDDAMETDSRSGWQGKGALEDLLRERIRATIELLLFHLTDTTRCSVTVSFDSLVVHYHS
jgi:hypothetical protein